MPWLRVSDEALTHIDAAIEESKRTTAALGVLRAVVVTGIPDFPAADRRQSGYRFHLAELGLIRPIRKRDGDQCRFCQRLVSWRDRRSGLSGAYVDIEPCTKTSLETFVVGCSECAAVPGPNRGPLQPPPDAPVYSEITLGLLGASL